MLNLHYYSQAQLNRKKKKKIKSATLQAAPRRIILKKEKKTLNPFTHTHQGCFTPSVSNQKVVWNVSR